MARSKAFSVVCYTNDNGERLSEVVPRFSHFFPVREESEN